MDGQRAGSLALRLPLGLLLALASCSEPTSELDQVCVRAQLLPILTDMITRSGRTLNVWGGWNVGQIEPDGSFTSVTSLDVDLSPLYTGTLEHDPISGRMWLLATDTDEPARLYQFDAAGQVEWMVELIDVDGPFAGTLLYHDDSIVSAVATRPVGQQRTLVVERRDLAGETLWTRTNLPLADEAGVFASARLVGVSGDVLSMIATPPLIDYGPSYPLTLDVETGAVIWSGTDGHDPLRMIADDEHLFLAWTAGPRHDPDKLPQQVEIDPAKSALRRVTPNGTELASDEVEWPNRWRAWDDDDLALAWMGERVVTLVAGSEGRAGVTVHAKDGTLECQGKLDLEIARFGVGVGIESREQWLVGVEVGVGEPDAYGGYQGYEQGVLMLEPL